MTDDVTEDKNVAEDIDELEEPNEIEDMPAAIIGDDGEVVDADDDEAIIGEEFTPTEGESEFDPEDPDAYLYTAPKVNYSDSAEEDELDADWLSEDGL